VLCREIEIQNMWEKLVIGAQLFSAWGDTQHTPYGGPTAEQLQFPNPITSFFRVLCICCVVVLKKKKNKKIEKQKYCIKLVLGLKS